MPIDVPTPSDLLATRWIARVGAAESRALALALEISAASAERRLARLRRLALCHERTVLADRPALWHATPAGLRAVGLARLGPCPVSPSTAAHLAACAELAARLRQRHPDHELRTERELRLDEAGREGDERLACPSLEVGPRAGRTHRPDLVLWPREGGLPIAIEVELSVKSAARLREICRGWARSRTVAGAVYYASPAAGRAVEVAVRETRAQSRVVVVPLAAVARNDPSAA